ncbi:MAG: aminotransferase class IV [Saprospiraceae bacterium]
MKQFLETICIRDGQPQNLEWHQRRVDETLKNFYPVHHHTWTIDKWIDVPLEFQEGLVRCRIVYDAHLLSIHYFLYTSRMIHSLKLIEGPPGIDYRYKYADRKTIEELYNQRRNADDVLITKDGWITDTSIGNIAFGKNGRWYTPSIPLLAGTTWKRLISRGILIPKPIHQSEILTFDHFKTFNAMNDWEQSPVCPVANINKCVT